MKTTFGINAFAVERYNTNTGRWYLYFKGKIIGRVIRVTQGNCKVVIQKTIEWTDTDLTDLQHLLRDLNQL